MKFGESRTQITFDFTIDDQDSFANLVNYGESTVEITLILRSMVEIQCSFGHKIIIVLEFRGIRQSGNET
jgi:hypothetical protein